MDLAAGAEARDATLDRRACGALPAQVLEDRLVARRVAGLVGLAEEDLDPQSAAVVLHRSDLPQILWAGMRPASICPAASISSSSISSGTLGSKNVVAISVGTTAERMTTVTRTV